jgi:NAD(P)-dependent dehydrogenase (short-subunit alcohol dehydrogenase family)
MHEEGAMQDRRVALVTGASRGIGKAIALRLAEAGFDVAFTARTQHEGDGRAEPGSTRSMDAAIAIPGSLDATRAAIVERGRRAMPIQMDLLDADAVAAAPRRVLAEWGRIDVLVNNAIFQGQGNLDRVVDLTAESMTRLVVANYVHQVLLTQPVLAHMAAQGEGRIVNLVSGSAQMDPQAPAGEGGWGIGYSASKAAFARVAGGINAELAPAVVAFNVDPGNTITERRRATRPNDPYAARYGAESPDSTAVAVAWLATDGAASRHLGEWIRGPQLAADLGLAWNAI